MAAQGGPRDEELAEATAEAADKATAVAEEATKAIEAGGRALATTPIKEEAPTKDTSPSGLPKEPAEWEIMQPWTPAMIVSK